MRGESLLLVVLLAVALVGPAAAQPSTDRIDADCQDRPRTVLLYVEHGAMHDDEVALYPGTRVYVAYCGNRGEKKATTRWGITSEAGFSDPEQLEYTYRAVVPEQSQRVVLDVDTIRDKDPSNELVVTVRQSPGVQSNLTGTRLTFRPKNATAYHRTEQAYLDASAAATAAASELNRTAETIESADRATFLSKRSTATATLQRLNASRRAADRNASLLRELLYPRATSERLPPGRHAQALEALHRKQAAVSGTTAGALARYNSALDAVADSARQTILTNMVAGIVIGLVIGAVGSGYRIREYGQKAQDFSDFGGGDFDRSLVLPQVGVGIALLLAGITLLILTGLGGVLV